jgi:hypothetical protein
MTSSSLNLSFRPHMIKQSPRLAYEYSCHNAMRGLCVTRRVLWVSETRFQVLKTLHSSSISYSIFICKKARVASHFNEVVAQYGNRKAFPRMRSDQVHFHRP